MMSEGVNKVSVFMLVYNQEHYIENTLISILNQETNFHFNLVIGDDYSTDNTLFILKKYQADYPKKIKLITSDKNIGLIQNFVRTSHHLDGEYIAICDGDDYWTDVHKLQKQVDFLEENKDYSIVFSNKIDLLPDGEKIFPTLVKKDTSTIVDLVKGNFIPSVTVLLKNKIRDKSLPNWITKFPYGDWPLYLYTTCDGSKIKFQQDIVAVYRKNIGVSSEIRKINSKIAEINLNILKDIYRDKYFSSFKKEVKNSICQHSLSLISALNKEGYKKEALKHTILHLLKFPSLRLFKVYLKSLFK